MTTKLDSDSLQFRTFENLSHVFEIHDTIVPEGVELYIDLN